jgi:hypothetical protein
VAETKGDGGAGKLARERGGDIGGGGGRGSTSG